jgi:hypothetical protein
MLRPPSLQHEYDEYYSRDPAFSPPALRPDPGAGPEAKAALAKALAEHAERVRIARERGDWSALKTAGEEPTKFTFRQVPGDVFSRVQDDIVDDKIGSFELPMLMFRIALVSVNLGPEAPKLKTVVHPRYGRLVDTDVPNYLCTFDEGRAIVAELGGIVLERSIGPSPKS